MVTSSAIGRAAIKALKLSQRELGSGIKRGSDYWFHKPWPRQLLALSIQADEIFFGGAAGGGKSDFLLMAALQHVHIPGYAALILRKNYKLLSKAGSIMDRAVLWLRNTDARWNKTDKRFTFPSGAVIDFGYIERPIDWMNYQGTEYQTILWDELTELPLAIGAENNPYVCLRRSMRSAGLNVPERVYAASNPGNVGHAFVKDRFITDGIEDVASGVVYKDLHAEFEGKVYTDKLAYVKSYLADNPAINRDAYVRKLAHLPAVTRARLLAGDWDASEFLQISPEWIRHYRADGAYLHELLGDGVGWNVPWSLCRRFATIDTAGTSRDKAEEQKGKPPSWSVCGIWDYHSPTDRLFLRDVWRARASWGELKGTIPHFLRKWNCQRVKIENAHLGQALGEEMQAAGFQVDLVGPMLPGMSDGWRGAKLERAICSGFLNRMQDAKVWIPERETAPWVDPYIAELIAWGGTPDEQADQIDVSSYAAFEAGRESEGWGGAIKN